MTIQTQAKLYVWGILYSLCVLSGMGLGLIVRLVDNGALEGAIGIVGGIITFIFIRSLRDRLYGMVGIE